MKKQVKTVRKFEKKWVPHGHIMVYKWVSDEKRESDERPSSQAGFGGASMPDPGDLPSDVLSHYSQQLSAMRALENAHHQGTRGRSSPPPPFFLTC